MAEAELPAWLLQRIGPRQVGGRYFDGYWQEPYDVENLQIRQGDDGGYEWSIVVRGQDGRTRTHCTAWDDRRDKVIFRPPADVRGRR